MDLVVGPSAALLDASKNLNDSNLPEVPPLHFGQETPSRHLFVDGSWEQDVSELIVVVVVFFAVFDLVWEVRHCLVSFLSFKFNLVF